MKYIKDALLLDSLEEIKEEIKERQELKKLMVGQLYPSILTDEIYQLNMKYRIVLDLNKQNENR